MKINLKIGKKVKKKQKNLVLNHQTVLLKLYVCILCISVKINVSKLIKCFQICCESTIWICDTSKLRIWTLKKFLHSNYILLRLQTNL